LKLIDDISNRLISIQEEYLRGHLRVASVFFGVVSAIASRSLRDLGIPKAQIIALVPLQYLCCPLLGQSLLTLCSAA
jgi:hypothetical protein